MKILLVGGGSGGSVSPLLAVAKHILKTRPKAEFLFVGSKNGPEQKMAQNEGIKFIAVTSGKWRRYFSWKNFAAPFLIVVGFVESFKVLKSFQPDCIFGTGSFVQVPVVWAAWFLKIPVVLHQQDAALSLANKLCELCAAKITVTFAQSAKNFSTGLGIFYKKHPGDKLTVTGNPFREELRAADKGEAQKFFNLKTDLPTLLVLGGGTGAEFFNTLILDCLPQLTKTVQIIHSTGGRGKIQPSIYENYHSYDFIQNMAGAYAAADIVLARAGLSTLTELSNLRKLSIIVPMPQSHQELNGLLLIRSEAAIVLNQKRITPAGFVALIRKVLFAQEAQNILKHNIGQIMPHEANEKISDIIYKLTENA
jgi:UDP-N-acetylglucosamine--N-acetylmuramyl-(pentapeptide) pyrophosphoryl-undecaprenol N-acetylglucosamine transferase